MRRLVAAQHHDARRQNPRAAASPPPRSPPRRRRRSRSGAAHPPARFCAAAAGRFFCRQRCGRPPVPPSRRRAATAPARASPRRCADRSRRDARDSGCRHRPRRRRRAARDNGCNAHRSQRSPRPPRTSKHVLLADMADQHVVLEVVAARRPARDRDLRAGSGLRPCRCPPPLLDDYFAGKFPPNTKPRPRERFPSSFESCRRPCVHIINGRKVSAKEANRPGWSEWTIKVMQPRVWPCGSLRDADPQGPQSDPAWDVSCHSVSRQAGPVCPLARYSARRY